MIKKNIKRKDKINFLLENKHYQRLHLLLYISSVILIVFIYFITIVIFSTYSNSLITGIFSITIGLLLFFKRNKMVKFIDEKIQERKRKSVKKENKDGLRTTLRKITPKNKNLKLNIRGKVPFSEKFMNLKKKFKKEDPKLKGKIKEDYIEIK